MFGLGNKDKDGRQVRLEHRGKHIRASRTGGVSLRAENKIGKVNLTANTSKGVRASTRIANGTRIAFQNSRLQLIGRWRSGPLGFNLSKSGASASYKNKVGTFNFIKPRYSSFKLGGIQIRGKNAAHLHLIYMLIIGSVMTIVFAMKLSVYVFWMLALLILFLWDFIKGFFRGVLRRVT